MTIRKPAVAGQFYPGDRNELLNMLDGLFSISGEKLSGSKPLAVIAPHAGYVFSGKQAARAYACLKDYDYHCICLISPSHQEYFPALSVYPGDAYETPLGTCPVDRYARDMIAEMDGVILSMKGHRGEHALEVQLPFVQYVLGDIPILPMVMGDQGPDSIRQAADCAKHLYQYYGDNILFIASSDLSHFHSVRIAEEMDGTLIRFLEKADRQSLFDHLSNDEIEACGGGPILAILEGLDVKESEITVLGYSHSGMVLHDRDSVVGYTSAIIRKD